MRQMYHLGFYGWAIKNDIVKQFLSFSRKNIHGEIIKNISDNSTRMMDCLFFINPSFDDNERTAFFEYIEDGGTAILMISPGITGFSQSKKIISKFGLRVLTTHKTDILTIRYTENYPNEAIRGTKNHLYADRIVDFTLFAIKRNVNEQIIFPLIISRNLFTTHIIAAKITYGQGAVIIMNVVSLDKDRLLLLDHLLEIGGPIRENQQLAMENELKANLPSIIKETFEVFDEIPLPVIQRKVERNGIDLDEINFLLLIEELIREGKVYAKIRGSTLVKR